MAHKEVRFVDKKLAHNAILKRLCRICSLMLCYCSSTFRLYSKICIKYNFLVTSSL